MSKSGQMQTQLEAVRGKIKTRPIPPIFGNALKNPQTWKKDGEDHINVWEEAATDLGRMLSHRYKLQFNHSHFGRFTTIEGFDAYIQSKEKDDRLRFLNGARLRMLISQGITRDPVQNFRAILVDTYYQRIKQSAEITKLFIESTLPFDLYYVVKQSGVRVRPARASWFIQGLEEVRRAMKEGVEPDLGFLMVNAKIGIYGNFEKQEVTEVKEQPKKKPNKPKAKKPQQAIGVAKVDPESIPVDLPDDIGNRAEVVASDNEIADDIGNRVETVVQ